MPRRSGNGRRRPRRFRSGIRRRTRRSIWSGTRGRISLHPPQQVTLRDRRPDDRQPSRPTDRDRKMMTFPITAAQFGTGDMAELMLDVDRTFAPGAGDTRELGIRVFHAFVEPK